MSISIVARFLDPVEAEIAASALRSAGFDAVAMDQHFAAVDPLARQSLGGMRVGVPQEEAAEAAQWLGELRAARRTRRPTRPRRSAGWRIAAGLFGFLHPVFGWLVVSIADRRTSKRPLPLLSAMLLTLLISIVAGSLVFGVIGALMQWANPRLSAYG